MLGPTDAATARQPAAAVAPASADRLDWWREARFGMFIHWGLYAIPAGEWGDKKDHGEWIMNTAHIPVEDYEKYREKFNPVKFDAGKIVQAWALEGDLDAAAVRSNTFSMQWPPRSGRMQDFPEVDRAEWFSVAEARKRINPAQEAFLDRLMGRFD